VVIGPEGGFAPDELTTQVPTVSLGESILRAETAAIVAGALMVRAGRGLQ
jgi:RsmE family RNA methyltransferase